MSKKLLTGIVVSDKMDKTRVVKVETLKTHPKYKRRYRSHKRYKAHDGNNEYKVNEKVVIEEANPMSKDKQWKIIRRAS
jgi:small subunit ribosomal protein S17